MNSAKLEFLGIRLSRMIIFLPLQHFSILEYSVHRSLHWMLEEIPLNSVMHD